MKHIVVFQVIVAVLLIISILLQSKGTGLGAGFGGGDGGSYYSKRGFEKFLLYGAVVLTILFVVLSGINVFVAQQALQ